ncbi:anthranilate synthase component II [Aquibacillus salsiterrae]|uniref:Aminodeoxychorismate/anthranilate synthase component II n=1 Tax=Aquibacillus salsiterrae TaxID=2950439 RepID=A0A9X3WF06_9BACI|nr:aminodeoxychorismate/anthranilate synthase component II [Aquibacillus salsiterrae]MDC3416204.1 aminodeoxychorismate/anthranilate synthase component II [Aquibacillus salsiterrae]
MITIIDNYDSFTYNLYQYFKQLDSHVTVLRNDEITPEDVRTLKPDLIVLSPGPGRPSDSGNSGQILTEFYQHVPILGICLGFQLIVEFFGGIIEKGAQPMHGKVSMLSHDGKGAYVGIPSPTKVTRYHSLVATMNGFPKELTISSMTTDGVIMGTRHTHYPVEGIQFHPESILTEHGFQMITNCYKQALAWKKKRGAANHESFSSI